MKNQFCYYFLGNAFIQSVNFLILPIIGRRFSPSEYAIIPILEIYLMLFCWLTSMMILSAMDRYYFDQRVNRGEMLNTVFTFLLGAGGVSFLAVAILVAVFGVLREYYYIILLATLHQILLQLYLFPLEKLKLDQKPGAFLLFSLLKSFCYLSVFWLLIVGLGRDLASMYEAQVYSSFIVLCLFFWYDTSLRSLRLTLTFSVLKRLLSFSAPLIVSGIGMYMIESSSRFFIKYYISDAALGNFSFIYKMVNALTVLLLMPATSVWTPYVFSNLQNEPLIKRSMTKVFTLMTAAALFVVMGLLCNYLLIIDLLSRGKFQIPVEVFLLLSIGYVLYCLLPVISPGFHIREKTKDLVKYFLVGGVANLLLNAVLIPRFELLGAGASTLFSFLLVLSLYMIHLRQIFAISYEWKKLLVLWGVFLAGAAMAIGGEYGFWKGNLHLIGFLIAEILCVYGDKIGNWGQKVLHYFFRCHSIYCLDITKPLPEEELPYCFKILDSRDVELLKKFSLYRSPSWFRIVLPRLGDFSRYRALAFIDRGSGKIIYLCWICFRSFYSHDLNRYFVLKDKEAYLFDDFTLPEWRSKGIHKAMMARRINYCYGNHIRKLYITIRIFHSHPVRTVLKFGFRWQGTVFCYNQGTIMAAFRKIREKVKTVLPISAKAQ